MLSVNCPPSPPEKDFPPVYRPRIQSSDNPKTVKSRYQDIADFDIRDLPLGYERSTYRTDSEDDVVRMIPRSSQREKHSSPQWSSWDLPQKLWNRMTLRSRIKTLGYRNMMSESHNLLEDEIHLQGLSSSYDRILIQEDRQSRQATCKKAIVISVCIPLSAIGLYILYSLLVPMFLFTPPDPFINWGRSGTTSEGLPWYPTNFLQDVIPIACHSHNDYWRKVPLFSALYAGCISTEADVWDFGGQHLFVGHNNAALTANRTFLSLYVDPLVKILEHQNPSTEFYNRSSHGVFDTDHEQSLTLLVDLKTDGTRTWPRVLEQLEPLRKRDWLTFVADGVVHKRPITVVGTGETPFNILTANATYRDAFFDAPLGIFWKDPLPGRISLTSPEVRLEDSSPFARSRATSRGQGNAGTSVNDDYNPGNSYYASASFFDLIGVPWRFGKLSEEQTYKLRGHIAGAHEKGLRVRLWDTPAWPRSLREGIWRLLVDEGVDVLNVDDLERAKSGLW